jgi:hypothetical protein
MATNSQQEKEDEHSLGNLHHEKAKKKHYHERCYLCWVLSVCGMLY